jgi:hypothetical protein
MSIPLGGIPAEYRAARRAIVAVGAIAVAVAVLVAVAAGVPGDIVGALRHVAVAVHSKAHGLIP